MILRRDYSHFAGCLLGGAIGDALGAPIEFLSLPEIRRRFGPKGVTTFVDLNHSGLAEFTDDTQMTLFTAEGVIIARDRGLSRGIWNPTESLFRAYLRWLRTQRLRRTGPTGELTREGWLLGYEAIWRVKAPGNTCLSALGSSKLGTPDNPLNDSKGCGGVMRVAPLGLAFPGDAAFEMAVRAAALTHGHPTGFLTAGVFAQTIAEIIAGHSLEESIRLALATLARWPNHEETLTAVSKAVENAQSPNMPPSAEVIETMGAGWVAEEALAISLYCALVHPTDFTAAVLLAINHSGDSDSTGAITGNLLGALLGLDGLPSGLLSRIELRSEIENMAEEMLK